MTRIKLMLTALFVSLLGITGATLATGAPAQAAYGGSCAVNALCLYQWKNLDAPTDGARWQSSYANIEAHSNGGYDGCLNLPPATWANGDPVSDNSASLMFNTGLNGPGSGYLLVLYNWVNCNQSGQFTTTSLGNNTFKAINDLSTVPYEFPTGGSYTEYHSITSVQIIHS